MVDLTPVVDLLREGAKELLGVLLLVLVGAAVEYIRRWQIEEKYKRLIENALAKGAGLFKAYADEKIDTTIVPLHADIRSKPLAAGVQYVINHAKPAVEYFKMDPDHLAEGVLARVGTELPPPQPPDPTPGISTDRGPLSQRTRGVSC